LEQTILVHKRIQEKHPEIFIDDVLEAWKSRIKCQVRTGPWPPQYVAIGFDKKGRALQMVAMYDPAKDELLIFHAMKATETVKKELGFD
jgi:uncharacterized protein YeaC (DUF1315 family)